MTTGKEEKQYPALGYMLKGYFYYSKEEDLLALEQYIRAKEYAENSNNVKQIIDINQNIANIKFVLGKNKEALDVYLEQYKFIKNQPNFKKEYSLDYVYVLDHLAKSYLRKHDVDSVKIFLDEGILFSKEIKEIDLYNSFLLSSGIYSYFKGNYKIALDSLNKAEPYLKDEANSMYYYYKGKILKESKDKNFINSFKKVDTIYQINKILFLELKDSYNILYKYYIDQNNKEKQLYYLKNLLNVDSLLRKKNFELEKTIVNKLEIPKLKQEKNLLVKELKNKNDQSNLLIKTLIVISVISLIVILSFIRRQKRNKQKFNQIISNLKIQNRDIKQSNNLKKPTNSKMNLKISNIIIEDILSKLNSFEKDKGFIKNGLTLNGMAKEFNTNSSYLSKVINHYKGLTFSKYINRLRIDYAIKELESNIKFRNFTINAIADEVGFNNAESFSKYFYKEKGIYPSYFIKQLNKSKFINQDQ
ncbi:MAG: AraC family transcriptional regulator [Mesoflavibacter sp.]|nr:AraC family transcriptional regulator [Mesoflavibacter sp.]